MDNITRRILIITKLKGLGFNDSDLFSKVMIGRGNTLKAIINKYIKGKNLDTKKHIQTLLQLKQFRIENYMCAKCLTWHYLGTKIYHTHLKHSNNIHHFTFQKEMIDQTLTALLTKTYHNNKNNKEFQSLIDFIDGYCKSDILKVINSDLRKYIIAKYRTFKEITYNSKVNEFNHRLQTNIRKVKEMIDLIDYHNFLNSELDKSDRQISFVNGKHTQTHNWTSKYTRLQQQRKFGNIADNLIQYRIRLMNHINSDRYLTKIFDKLDITDGKINNTQLHKKLEDLWEDHKMSMLELRYGIKHSDKKEMHNKFISENNTFYDRDSSAEDLQKLADNNSLNIFFCYDNSKKFRNYKFWLNYVLKNTQITFIDKGIDSIKRKHRKPSKFIIYKYKMNQTQINQLITLSNKVFDLLDKNKPFTDYTLMQLIDYCNQKHIYLRPFSRKYQILKSVIQFNKPITDIYTHNLKLAFTYTNRQNKLINYQKFLKSIGINEKISYTKLFISNYESGNNLFTYLANKRNVQLTHLERSNFDKDLGTLFYYISFEYQLHTEIKIGNEKIILNKHDMITNDRKYIHKILCYALRHDLIFKHFCQFLTNKINEIKHKKGIRLIRNDLIHNLVYEMKCKYELMNKRTNKAKDFKKTFESLEMTNNADLIKVLDKYDKQIKPFERFLSRLHSSDRFNISILNKTVFNLIKDAISLWNDKIHTRLINTTRSKIECIKYGLRLIGYNTMINIVEDQMNKVNENCTDKEITYENKFDELLTDYKVDSEMFVKYSAEISVPIKSFILAVLRILPHLDNKVLENYLVFKMYKMFRNYQTFENKVLA